MSSNRPNGPTPALVAAASGTTRTCAVETQVVRPERQPLDERALRVTAWSAGDAFLRADFHQRASRAAVAAVSAGRDREGANGVAQHAAGRGGERGRNRRTAVARAARLDRQYAGTIADARAPRPNGSEREGPYPYLLIRMSRRATFIARGKS